MWAFRHQRQDTAQHAEWSRSRLGSRIRHAVAPDDQHLPTAPANACGNLRLAPVRSRARQLWPGDRCPPNPVAAGSPTRTTACYSGGAPTSSSSRPRQTLEALHPYQNWMGRGEKLSDKAVPSRRQAGLARHGLRASVHLDTSPCGITDLGVQAHRKSQSWSKLAVPCGVSLRLAVRMPAMSGGHR
jgi:hypothetical protein